MSDAAENMVSGNISPPNYVPSAAGPEWARWAVWALDFTRAVSSRGWLARLLFWLALGEAGRHEFWGLVWAIERDKWDAFYPASDWRSDNIARMPLFWRPKGANEYGGRKPLDIKWRRGTSYPEALDPGLMLSDIPPITPDTTRSEPRG